MHRLQATALAIAAALTLSTGCSEEPAPKEKSGGVDAAELAAAFGPGVARDHDVVLITFDTTRADRVGFSGGPAGVTPNVDALAGNGASFLHAFAPTPLTLPSHTTLMTGLDPYQHGARNNGTFVVKPTTVTLAERLQVAGYRTGAFIGSFPLDSRFGLDQGFEVYDDSMDLDRPGHYPERRADAVANATIRFIESTVKRKKKFFAWAHFFDPHSRYVPPGEFADRFRSDPYQGEIAWVDHQIGRIIARLRTLERFDRTLFIITADHGESLGEHGESTHGIFLYDSTIRVPLLVSDASIFPSPLVVDDRIVGLVDITPTVLEMVGLGPMARADGRSLGLPPESRRALYIETLSPMLQHGWAPLYGLRRFFDKYIEAPEPEYYGVVADRGETNNLAEAATPEFLELQKRLREIVEVAGAPENVEEAAIDPRVAERLAALGYVRTNNSGQPRRLQDPKRMIGLWQRTEAAFALFGQKKATEALKVLRDVTKGDPGNAEAWYLATSIYQAAGRLKDAEGCLKNAVRLRPEATGWAGLADLAYMQGNYAAGDMSLRRARQLDPNCGLVYIIEGIGLKARGKTAEAKAAFEKAMAVDPGHATRRARTELEKL